MVFNVAILTMGACMFMAVFMLIFNENVNSSVILYLNATQHPKSIQKIEDTKTEGHGQFQCVLPKYDSWDKDVIYYFYPRTGEDNKCDTKFKYLSKLEDRKIVSEHKDYDCFGRCITRSTDYENTVGKWKEMNETLDCDIVEAQCYHFEAKNASYAMLHTQIVPIEEKTLEESENPHYSVFVLLVDSMAASQADRNIPKTMRYFEKSMEAVTFPYVNKVGINSRPNGMALWLGKQIETIDRTAFGLPTLHADLGWKESCDDYVDNLTSIFKDFNDAGYTTFLADDWGQGVLNWPNCYGFDKQPTDHIMQPFQIHVENKNNELLYNNYTEDNCIYQHKDILKYLNQFIDAYKDRPKFAWFWSSLQSHDSESSSVRLDTDLYEFLLNNKEEMDKSFVIFMGDHGLRFGKVTETKVGALDVNNPLLSISIPKELRGTEMHKIMRENAKKMQTHYDTRSTLLDIIKHLPHHGPDNLKPIDNSKEKGESLLRLQKIQERSCMTLPIPFAYCICDFQMETVVKTSEEAIDIGKALIWSVNEQLRETNSTDLCYNWKFSEVIEINGYQPIKETGTYWITVGVSKAYNKAQFRAMVNKSKTGKYTVGGVDRVDSYGKRGDCVRGDLKPICECKKKQEAKEKKEENKEEEKEEEKKEETEEKKTEAEK